MTFDPPYAFSWFAPLLIIGVLFGGFLTWRAARLLPSWMRIVVPLLRVLGLAGIAYFLLNPGRWEQAGEALQPYVSVLIDQSESMATEDVEGKSRWSAAVDLAEELAAAYPDEVDRFVFADNLGASFDPQMIADGQASDLDATAVSLLAQSETGGRRLAGVIALTDGRQTALGQSDAAVRARAKDVPIHAVTLGGEWGKQDLRLRAQRGQLAAFSGQEVQVGVLIENEGLEPQRVRVEMIEEKSGNVTEEVVNIGKDDREIVQFPYVLGDETVSLKLRCDLVEGEQILHNNEATVRVQLLESHTRVFIAEGSPYWDSKFLAQLLRKQEHLKVDAVHRLNADRYIHIRSDLSEEDGVEQTRATFPETMEELSQYDVIMFGKGADAFLDTDRAERLRNFVRDQGGAVFFARGKSYAGEFPALEALEPVVWGEGEMQEFELAPSADGEQAGLFGEALPGSGDPIWGELPVLKDGREVASIKPFTRILARGQYREVAGGGLGQGDGFPALLARRYGLGVTGLLNADGMWKWDFYPEARELGNMYAEFWTQAVGWAVSYSEFLPGHHLSLRVDQTEILPGTTIAATMGWRGGDTEPQPVLEAWREGNKVAQVAAAPSGDGESLTWNAGLTLEEAGDYQLRVRDAGAPNSPQPEVVLRVRPPPGEADEPPPIQNSLKHSPLPRAARFSVKAMP